MFGKTPLLQYLLQGCHRLSDGHSGSRTPPLPGRTDALTPAIPTNMQWFFVQKPTAAAYRRLHASAAACLSAAAASLPPPRGRRRHLKRSSRGLFTPRRLGASTSSSERPSAAEDQRPLGQPEAENTEKSAAEVVLFLPRGDDDDAEYVQVLLSGLVEESGEKPGKEPGYLLIFLSMVQIGGAKHRRTEPNSWPALLACKQGGGPAPMRWVNFSLPHPERLSSPTSCTSSSSSFSFSTTSSSFFPVSAKSMRFIWSNIFSKGSHMLQCLCGRSLKKNKNPTGEFVARACGPFVRFDVECHRGRLCCVFVRARRSVCASRGCAVRLLFLCNRRCAASECTKSRERRGDIGGGIERAGG